MIYALINKICLHSTNSNVLLVLFFTIQSQCHQYHIEIWDRLCWKNLYQMVLIYSRNLIYLFVSYAYYRSSIPSWILAFFIPSKLLRFSLRFYGRQNYVKGLIVLRKNSKKDTNINLRQIHTHRVVLFDSTNISNKKAERGSKTDDFEVPLYPIGETQKDSSEVPKCPKQKFDNMVRLYKNLRPVTSEDSATEGEKHADIVQMLRQIMTAIKGLFEILPRTLYCGSCSEFLDEFGTIVSHEDLMSHICDNCNKKPRDDKTDRSKYINTTAYFPQMVEKPLYEKLVNSVSDQKQEMTFDDKMCLLITFIQYRIEENEDDFVWNEYMTIAQSSHLACVPSWLKLYWLLSYYELKMLFMDDAYQSVVGDMLILGNLVYDERNAPSVKSDEEKNLVPINPASCIYETHSITVTPFENYNLCLKTIKQEEESSVEEVFFKGMNR